MHVHFVHCEIFDVNIRISLKGAISILILTLLPMLESFCPTQSVSHLTADTCLTTNPGAACSIPARSPTFREIYHQTISTAFLHSSAD